VVVDGITLIAPIADVLVTVIERLGRDGGLAKRKCGDSRSGLTTPTGHAVLRAARSADVLAWLALMRSGGASGGSLKSCLLDGLAGKFGE